MSESGREKERRRAREGEGEGEGERTSPDRPVKHFHASHSIHSDLFFSKPLTFLGVIVLKRLRPLTSITLAPLRRRHDRGSLPLLLERTAGKGKHDSF